MPQLYGAPRKERAKRTEELLKMFNLYEKRNSSYPGTNSHIGEIMGWTPE
ncbi:hypothetical protein H5T88_03775 [bacterium]|nr:hypothetical protein [bacterium]